MIWDTKSETDVLCWRGDIGGGLERRLMMLPKNNVIFSEQIYRAEDRMPHSPEGVPTYIVRWPNGHLRIVEYLVEGKLHRNREPARITYDEQGRMVLAEWYRKGKLHRKNGPASMGWKNGKLYREAWENQDRQPVRDDVPIYRIRERRGWWFEIWNKSDGTRDFMRRHDDGRVKFPKVD